MAPPKPFQLIWFSAPGPRNWDTTDFAARSWTEPETYGEMAQVLERRGAFDAVVFADGTTIPDTYQGTIAAAVKFGLDGIFLDPVPVLAAMASVTRRIGLVATLSTAFYPPFHLARMLATLDHFSRGRAGWNLITSIGQTTGQNFGTDALPSAEERYDRADEFLELTHRLWGSWEPGAVLMDRETGRFADGAKVHEIDFVGKWFSSRGPLTVPRSPQGSPVIMQAGGSDRGRDFAAKNAEIIITHRNSVGAMKDFRRDLHRRMELIGRDPSTCRIFFTVRPFVGDTTAEAEEARQRALRLPSKSVEAGLATYSARMAYDFSGHPLDEPLDPNLRIAGSQGMLQQYTEGPNPPTLREIALAEVMKEGLVTVGDPQTVAEELGEIMAEVGGDGIAVRDTLTPSAVVPFTDRVVPLLQDRGLVRSGYRYPTFRENLLDPDLATTGDLRV